MKKTKMWFDVQHEAEDGLWYFKIFIFDVEVAHSAKGYQREAVCRGVIKQIQEGAAGAAVAPPGPETYSPAR